MLAGGGFLDLAHFKVPVLHLNPPEAFLDLPLNGPVFDVFHFPVLLPILLNNLHVIGHFLFQLLYFKGGVV